MKKGGQIVFKQRIKIRNQEEGYKMLMLNRTKSGRTRIQVVNYWRNKVDVCVVKINNELVNWRIKYWTFTALMYWQVFELMNLSVTHSLWHHPKFPVTYILLHHWIMPCVHYHAGKTRHIFSCITGSCVYTITQGKPAIYSPASLDHAMCTLSRRENPPYILLHYWIMRVHYHAGKTRHIFSCITGSCHMYTITQGKPAIYSPASLDHAMCTLSRRENPPYILLHHWIMRVYTIMQGKPAIYSPASLDHAMCTLSCSENPPYILLHHWIMPCVHYHAGKTRHIFSCITGSCVCTLSCRENPPYILLHHWIMPCVHYHAGKTRHIFSCITGSCVYTITQGKPAIYSPASLDHACVHYHAGKTRHIFSCITGSCVYTITQGKPAIYSPASLDHAMCTLSCRENPPYILLHHWIMRVYIIMQGKPAIYSPASLDHACVHFHAGKTRHIFSCITGSCHVYTIM